MAVFFILCVGILNLAMGFGVAVYAARRFETLGRSTGRVATPTQSATTDEPALETPTISDDDVDAVEDFLSGVASDQVVTAPEKSAEPEEDNAPEFSPEALLGSLEGQSEVEEAVVGFREKVEKFHDELTAMDEELRDTLQNPSEVNIKACLESLGKTNNEHIESYEQARKVFQKFREDIEEFHVLGDDLLAACEEESSRTQQTNEAIENFDYQGDLGDGCRRMLSETSQLLNANHHLRDAAEEAFVGVMRNEQRLDSLDDFARMDPLTGVLGRGGLEAVFDTWWREAPEQSKPLCLAMFDLDQFGQVNEKVGQKAGDRILHLFAQMLQTETDDNAKVARHSGQRFAVLLGNNDVRTATNVAERIRQTFELVEFHHHDDEFKMTVSCAVVEASSKETSDNLYKKAEAAIEEAKRYGRNRTFLHEGGYPTPVIPPSFTLSERLVTL